MSFTFPYKQPKGEPRAECAVMSNERGGGTRSANSAWNRVRLVTVVLLAFALTVSGSLAAEVRASLSRDVTVPGEPVRLEVHSREADRVLHRAISMSMG